MTDDDLRLESMTCMKCGGTPIKAGTGHCLPCITGRSPSPCTGGLVTVSRAALEAVLDSYQYRDEAVDAYGPQVYALRKDVSEQACDCDSCMTAPARTPSSATTREQS